jgi:hypothetical protein
MIDLTIEKFMTTTISFNIFILFLSLFVVGFTVDRHISYKTGTRYLMILILLTVVFNVALMLITSPVNG